MINIKRVVTTRRTMAALLGSTVAALAVAPRSATAGPAIIAPVLPVEQRPQPPAALTAARFSLIIDGVEVAAFNELVSLKTQTDPNATDSSKKEVGYYSSPLTGSTRGPHVILKRGMTGAMELWAWHQAAAEGQMAAARKSVSLVMYSTENVPVARFWLTNAWPLSVEATALKAGSSEIVQETVTLASEKIQRVSPS